MIYNKHLYRGSDLKEYEEVFQKIAREHPFNRRYRNYKLQEELVALNALCKIVISMYGLNDFRAASYAYIFTLPKIDEIISFCYTFMGSKDVLDWCNGSNDFCSVRQADGSFKNYSNLGFVFEYLKNQQMAIAARYFIEYNIQYLESNKSEKDYPSRARILQSAVWWVNQGLLGRFGLKMPFVKDKRYDIMPEVIIFATFPSSGKSYLVNTCNQIFAELSMIINRMGGFLRVGNEQGNIFRQSRQTMAMIENKLIFDIYPENKKYIRGGKYYPFNKSSEEEWGLGDVDFDPATCVFKTRDSAINSVRCRAGAFDDPSRGQQEINNLKIHNDIVQLYRGDFKDRFKSQGDKFILLFGTMYNPADVISLESQEALKGASVDGRFRNTYISADKKTIVIMNDCEDENGDSAYPEFISNDDLASKRKGLNDFDYACIWRQKPIPAEGLIFAYQNLQTYDKLNYDALSSYSVAYIDPTRRSAKDFFAMPICRRENESGLYYLCDAIYQQKSSRDLYDVIVEKIIDNKIIELVIEENVDTSLSTVIKDRLKAKGITYCEVKNKYNTVNKQQRIADMAGNVKKHMVFPSKTAVGQKSEIGSLTYSLTQYNALGANKNDDAADSVSGLVENIIVIGTLTNIVKSSKTLPF